MNYCPQGVAVADAHALRFVESEYEARPDGVFDVGTENLVYALRLLIRRGVIPHDKAVLAIDGKQVATIKANGGIDGEMPNYFEKSLDELLDL
jgi:hypothetical protein